MGDEASEVERFCPDCGQSAAVVQTVPWQPNFCKDCGADIEQ